MTDETPQMDMNKALFMNLVIMLSATAMQQLGKVMNPMTQEVELDLQGAQATIGMLSMLQAKTEGNLDDEETKLVQQTLSALQMNYVETANASAEDDDGDADETDETPEEEASTDDEASADPDGDGEGDDDSNGPKYHKSYD